MQHAHCMLAQLRAACPHAQAVYLVRCPLGGRSHRAPWCLALENTEEGLWIVGVAVVLSASV